jgi:hypothetical protein
LPFASTANSSGLPESLCSQNRPSVSRLATSPLASCKPSSRIRSPDGLQLGAPFCAIAFAGAVSATAIALATTHRLFGIRITHHLATDGSERQMNVG